MCALLPLLIIYYNEIFTIIILIILYLKDESILSTPSFLIWYHQIYKFSINYYYNYL